MEPVHGPPVDAAAEVLHSVRQGRLRRRGTWPAGVWARTPRPVQVARQGALRAKGVAGKAARVRTFAVGKPQVLRGRVRAALPTGRGRTWQVGATSRS